MRPPRVTRRSEPIAPAPRSGRSPITVMVVGMVSLVFALGLGACGEDSDEPAAVVLSPAGERGKTVAEGNGCVHCHSSSGSRSTGPTWQGLAGTEITLTDGTTVMADDDYLRRAILDPRAEVRDGFPDIMPAAYSGLSDDEVDDLLALLWDLSDEERPPG